MGYKLSNFVPGWQLTDEDMNKMDIQIGKNSNDIEELKKVENIYTALQNNLKLESDSNSIYLKYIKYNEDGTTTDYVISSVDKGADYTNYIPATSYEVLNGTTTVYVNEPYQFETAIQPSDSTQKISWKVSDVTIGNVNSLGTLQCKKCGNIKVSTWCGNFNYDFDIIAKRKVNLNNLITTRINNISVDGYLVDTTDENNITHSGFHNVYLQFNDSNNYLYSFLDIDNNWNNNLYIQPGETLTLNINEDDGYFKQIVVFNTDNGILDTSNDSSWNFNFEEQNGIKGALSRNDNYIKSFTYTNETNKINYFVFSVHKTNSSLTQEEFVNNSISILLEKE